MVAHINPDNPEKEQTVQEHLEGTAQVAKHLGLPLGMGYLAYIAGLYHDLGKWRQEFESYIRTSVSKKAGKVQGGVNHSSAGAIYIYQRYYKGSSLEKLTAQLICEAILSHHGVNDCMSVQGEDCFRKRVENLENLDYEEVVQNLKSSTISFTETDECFKKAVEEVSNFQKEISANDLSGLFTNGLIARMLLSILIDADRLDTAVFCGDRSPVDLETDGKTLWEISGSNLERKLDSFPLKEGIFALRRKIADECLEFANHPTGIYRLTVPTGGAKTLSSMRYAVNHARKLNKKRIFYIGPYLSILEQNSQVFREALGNEKIILEHHSNVIVEDSDETDGDCIDRYRHLTENWDSPVVITTFVQFLNTLFSGKTSSVRRFHNLTDSVIIIDEIQSLPIKMIHIFNMAMNYLCHVCRSTIVLCSATQPVLDQVRISVHMGTPADIISDVDGLYKQLKRVRVEEKKGILDTDRLCAFLAELMNVHKDMLVILNTKKAAETVYREMETSLKDRDIPVTLIHLSTNMCPEHRLSFINRIKNRPKEEPLLCISTSLIEAGVDLSFSCVIRSFAGLDSIAQAAGRCNRNGEEKEGVVYLIHYEEERLGRLDQIRKGAACSEAVVELFQKNGEYFQQDLLSRPALNAYYERYYYDSEQQRLMNYPVEKLNTNLVDLLSGNWAGKKAYAGKYGRTKILELALCQAFKTAGEIFAPIDQNTTGVLVPFEEGKIIINKLNGELMSKELMNWLRKGQRFAVNLYPDQLKELTRAGAVTPLKNGQVLALKSGFYDDHLGVVTEGKEEFLVV
ncbi:CRISPR-associated helicase/endonuclease Cas3 [Clostridium sp. Marseille-P2415]|uniref:CRISPR-associated helicase/endonuclease Cas3 n=2 Tax=Clostridium sp. Marseille-P2415 TaxID=1805471 RepID=UPI0009887FAB|nr:CRISPR-associated helicase/endonuclease Cas3 [Clostridium sp. Marseille-P2415]